MSQRKASNASNAIATSASPGKTLLMHQASRLALRSSIAIGAATAFSLLASQAAYASCTQTGSDIVCDDTTTSDTLAPANTPNDRGYQVSDNAGASLTVTAGSTVDGRGLAIQNDGTGAVTVVNNGTIRSDASPSTLGSAALNITANGGDIDYSGSGDLTAVAGGSALEVNQTGMGAITLDVGGNISTANADGINVTNAFTSGDIDLTVDGSINAVGGGVAGIEVNAQSVSGDVRITANGPIISTGRGIAATSNGGSITAVTGAVTAGTGAGVELSQSSAIGGGSLLLTTNGAVSGSQGILAFNSGSGDIAIVTEDTITGTNGLGMNVQGNGAISIDMGDTVTGSTGGLNLNNSATTTGDIHVQGDGGFVGQNGIAASINNFGTGSVIVNIRGASSATGATGVRVLDVQAIDRVSVNTGQVTATGANSDGVFVSTQSLTADVSIVTNGAVVAERTGIVANITNANATGDLVLVTNATTTGGSGIIINNAGSGRTQTQVRQQVTANNGGIGVSATGFSGDMSIDTNGVSAAGNTAIRVSRTDATSDGEVYVFSRGAVNGLRGIEASNANGTLYISTEAPVTATAGTAIRGDATGLVTVAVDGNVTARDYGVYTQAGSSDISINSGITQGQNGVFQQGNGTSASTSLTVAAGASVVGTTEYGAYMQPSNAINVVNNGSIQGVLGALRVTSAAGQTSTTSVTGSGNFVATNGHGIRIDQLGSGFGTLVDVTGSISATNGSGVLVNHTSNSGNIVIGTGTVSSTGAGNAGIYVDTTSTGSSIGINARGPVSGNLAGIYANLSSAAATGDIFVLAGQVTGGFNGVRANTNGNGDVYVETTGAVSGSDRGIEAVSNGGQVDVITAGVTAATGVGVVGLQRNAASNALVNITTNGNVTGQAIGLSGGTTGTGDVTVITHGTVTGNTDVGARIFGGGNVNMTANSTISGATTGLEISAGNVTSGNVVLNGTGGFSGQNGHGVRIDNVSNGSIAVVMDGATTAHNGSGYYLNNATNSGGMLIRTGNIDVTGSGALGIYANSRSLTGSVHVLSLGHINSTGGGMIAGLQTAGATGNVRVDNFAVINATQVGISASNAGSGNVEVYNFGSLTSTANQALGSSLNGGNFRLDNIGTITGNISVSGSNIAGSTFTNYAGAVWNTGNFSSSLSSTLANLGTINVGNGTTTIQGAANNSNRINFVGSGQFRTLSGFTNSGIVNAQNGATGNVFAVTGNYTGGGQFLADYNTGNGTADVLTITGAASGTTLVGLNRTGLGVLPTGFLPIITVNGAAANNAFAPSTNFATTGFLLESFGRNPANSQQFGILQQVNAEATDLGGMQTLAATVAPLLDDPISNFVNVKKDPSRNDKQFGLWLRASTADSDQDIATQISTGGISLSSNRSYAINQKAIQGGADFGLLNMGDDGWNLHLGITGGAGDADARPKGSAVRYDYNTKFVGGYVFLTKKGFTFDATLRREWREFSLASPGLFGNAIARQADGSATAGSVNAAWRLGKDQGFSVMPHVGYSFASAKMDALTIDAMSTLVAHKDKSSVGSVGAKLAYGFDLGGWQITPYADISGLKNWSNGEQGSVVFSGGGSTNFLVESTTFRDALRYSAGLVVRDRSGRFSAFAGAARTDGSGVESTALSIGARINF